MVFVHLWAQDSAENQPKWSGDFGVEILNFSIPGFHMCQPDERRECTKDPPWKSKMVFFLFLSPIPGDRFENQTSKFYQIQVTNSYQ